MNLINFVVSNYWQNWEFMATVVVPTLVSAKWLT